MLKRFTYIVVLVCNVLFFTGALALGLSIGTSPASAACSPGIPCTDYDLYNDPFAGIQTALNGLKSGERTITANLVDSDGTCDGNLMNQMYSKAFMEASRQVIMSEQIIHKPDSVLEYTCFKGYITAAASIQSEFSYTTHWKDPYKQDRETADDTITDTFDVYREYFNDNLDDYKATICNPAIIDGHKCANNLAEAMNYIVNASLDSYLTANFSHTYLGEATSLIPSGTPAGCADMATVWEVAKCLDFGEDDRFRTFQDLINADPRSIPAACSPGMSFHDNAIAGDEDVTAGAPAWNKLDSTIPNRINGTISTQCPASGAVVAGVNTDFSNDLIRVSNNCPSENVAGEHAYVMIDPIDYQDFLIMGAGVNSGRYIPGTGGEKGVPIPGIPPLPPDGIVTCAAPLPTGIPVITYEHDAAATGAIPELWGVPLRRKYVHYEYVCPNPGCFYRPPKQPLTETEAIPYFDDFVTNNGIGSCIEY